MLSDLNELTSNFYKKFETIGLEILLVNYYTLTCT